MHDATMERFSVVVFLCLLSFGLLKVVGARYTTRPTCTEVGFFKIYDGTCKNYYMCIDNGERLMPVMLSCASSAIFDPSQGRCVSENTTICEQTSLCPRYGRFPIQDTNCKRYYLCYWSGSAYTMMSTDSCPNTLVFEPTSEKCVSPLRYVCPGTQG